MLTYLVRMFAGCSHESTYRERRKLYGADVMHLVCHDCGHASPVVDRTADEHKLAIETGAVRVAHAQPRAAYSVKRGGLRRMA